MQQKMNLLRRVYIMNWLKKVNAIDTIGLNKNRL